MQIISAGNAEPLITVREWADVTGAAITATLIPIDELAALADHGHLHRRRGVLRPRVSLCLCQHLAANTAALQPWPYGEHAEVGDSAIAPLAVTAGDGRPSFVECQQHNRRVGCDGGRNRLSIGPLTVEEIGLSGPANPTRIAAVGRLDELDNRCDVVDRRDPEVQSRRANSVAQ